MRRISRSPSHTRLAAGVAAAILLVLSSHGLGAQGSGATLDDTLTVARIFSAEFGARGVGQLRWIEGG
ncbi:MAG: hypothetical protein ACLGIK_16745, partial [Gemmatimonadota bacterium]